MFVSRYLYEHGSGHANANGAAVSTALDGTRDNGNSHGRNETNDNDSLSEAQQLRSRTPDNGMVRIPKEQPQTPRKRRASPSYIKKTNDV